MASSTLKIEGWTRVRSDDVATSIAINDYFTNARVEVAAQTGDSALKHTLEFIKGFAERKRVGFYSSDNNYQWGEVTYDGNKTFTIMCYGNGQYYSSYTTIYIR